MEVPTMTMIRRIYVRLDQTQAQHLATIAERERRHPADQAAMLLERALAEECARAAEASAKEGDRDAVTAGR